MLYKLNEFGVISKIRPEDLQEELSKQILETVVDKYTVSTVFLGVDHDFSKNKNDPVLFETMIFDSSGKDIYIYRCCTLEQSYKMHEDAITWLKFYMYCNH